MVSPGVQEGHGESRRVMVSPGPGVVIGSPEDNEGLDGESGGPDKPWCV